MTEEAKECDHRFVLLNTAKWIGECGGYNTLFIRVDTFFCEWRVDDWRDLWQAMKLAVRKVSKRHKERA